MTFKIDGANGLTFPNLSTQTSAGQVLQVVQGTYATQESTNSTSYVSRGLTASITPKFSTSKILVAVSVVGGNDGYRWQYFTVYRNGTTNIAGGSGNPGGYVSNGSSVTDYLETVSFQILDAPATTSSTTYTLYTKGQSGGTYRTCPDNMPAYITLMEIAG